MSETLHALSDSAHKVIQFNWDRSTFILLVNKGIDKHFQFFHRSRAFSRIKFHFNVFPARTQMTLRGGHMII